MRVSVVIIVTILLIVPLIYAQNGGTVIHGSVSGTTSILTSDIEQVNENQSFILFTSRSSSSTPDDAQFTANFTNSTQVRFERYNTATTTIEYMIITSPDITVQRGTQALTSGTATHNVAINTVNLSKSFVVVDARCSSTSSPNTHGGFFTGNFTNTTNVLLTRGNAGDCAATVSWQVVSWESTTVHSGNTVIPDSTDTATASPTISNVSSAWLYFTKATIGTDPGMDSNLIRGTIDNPTQITFTDEPGTTYGSSETQLNWFVIEKEGAIQQNGSIAVTGDGTTTINTINISRTFLFQSGWNTGGGQTYTNSYVTFNFSNTTTITRDKQTGSQTQNVQWYTFELPDPDKIPDFSNESIDPANGTNYSLGTIHQFNITINNTNGSTGIQFDGVNYTLSNSSQINWEINFTNLAAGTYSYFWWAHGLGIEQPLNQTIERTYHINQSAGVVFTYLNNSRNNITIEKNTEIHLNGTRQAGERTIELIHNGTTINQGNGPLNNLTNFTSTGTHNITTRINSTTNYTQQTETWFVTVQDTKTPTINNIANISITNESAIIQWNTNEIANSTVHWGTTTNTTNTTTATTWVTSHSILLNNLQANTTYYYNITSCDPSNNCNTTTQNNFTTLTQPDTTPPTFNNITATPRETNASIYIELDEATNITINWGETTSLGNITTETSFLSTHNITITSLDPLTLYFYNLTACDPSDNCNTTGPHNFTTTDETAPTWSNNRTNPISGTTYTPGANYQFNVTWNDNVAVHTVLIQHNFTGTFQNESVNITGNEYHFNTTDLAAGEYQWKMYANDTSGNLGETSDFTFIIAQATSSINLTLNGNENSITVGKNSIVNITSEIESPTAGLVRIYQDGSQITSGNPTASININYTSTGSYNITASYGGNQNYTAAEITYFITVNLGDPSYPTNVQAENDIVTLSTTQTTLTVALTNTYNTSKAFIKVHHASGFTSTAEPDESTTTVRFNSSGDGVILERYATQAHEALVSYSILQADNIEVINFTKNWASSEETTNLALTQELETDYATKCFIETHRNIQVNSATVSDYAEQEVEAAILNTTHINLTRDTEGGGAAAAAIQYGYVVCFLDETTVQTGTFSVSGDLGSEDDITISSVNRTESWTTISYYQADDGVGQNALMPNITSTTQLTIHRDEAGGGQTAFGRYYLIDFEDKANSTVQHVEYNAPGSILSGTFGPFTAVDQNKTLLHCENTMTAGGGTAHTRASFVFEINASDNGVFFQEGRTRASTQVSDMLCQVITWPSLTTYSVPTPEFSNFSVSPDTETNYSPSTLIQLNVTINNTNGTVGLEFGGVNYTATNTSLIDWTVNLTDISAGSYNYNWWAYGVGVGPDAFESTELTYQINQSAGVVFTYLNNSRNNITIEKNTEIHLNGTRQAGERTIELIHNGTTINQGNGPLNNLTNFTSTGTHNITTRINSTTNYTQQTETWFVTVQDTKTPTINNIANISITNESAIIQWNTNEIANSTVHWGTTTNTTNTTTATTWVTSHSILLNNLQANTTYYYNITSCDPSNNCNTTTQNNFTTLTQPDTTPPTFNNITVIDIHQNNATIHWELDEAANGTVHWGYTASLGNNTSETGYFSSHDIALTNLSAVTTYFFNITSCDPSDNCNSTGIFNFTTIDETAPNWSTNRTNPLSGVTYSPGANYQFNATWTDVWSTIDTVLIEHNFTGTFQNESVNVTGNEYHFNTTDLAAGEYQWKMYANDTYGNLNETSNFTFIINKAPTQTNLTLNGSADNITIDRKQTINLTAHLLAPNGQSVRILQDGSELSSNVNNTSINRTFFVVGVFNITAQFDENENYSQAQTTFFVTVNGLPPEHPTNVQAENDIITMTTAETTVTAALTNTYDLTKAFIVVRHASGFTSNAEPDESTPTVRFNSSGDGVVIERYATQAHEALVSYSILQADNIEVINFTKNWASSEETDDLALVEELPANYATKCFIETHRNIRVNSANINDFAEQEVQARITNETHIHLQRDTEGGGAAAAAIQYGYVVCFLDETTVQTGTFSVSGDIGSEDDITISSVNRTESWTTISYYQADDGVGQNALMPNITSTTQLTIHRDEAGGGQTAFGRYYLIDFENEANANVQHIEDRPAPGGSLTHTTDAFTGVDQNKTLLHCENTMENGGGTAHTRASFVFEINSSDDGVFFQEGRTRNAGTQNSDVLCQVITWPNATSYIEPADLQLLNISFPGGFIEGTNGTISVDVHNNGSDDALNTTTRVNISYWNGSQWLIQETLEINTDIIAGGDTVQINFSWLAQSGTHQFHAYADIDDQSNESNETNNNMTVNHSISSWHIFYGYASTDFLILSDGGAADFRAWPGLAEEGNIYAIDTDHNISYLDLLPLNESDDLAEADQALNMTGHNDSLSAFYDTNDDGLPDNFKNISIAGAVFEVPIVNTTNSSDFQTGILWDSSSGGSSYNGSQPLAFITTFNGTYVGFYGTYDYEMRVPTSLEEMIDPTDSINLILELT